MQPRQKSAVDQSGAYSSWKQALQEESEREKEERLREETRQKEAKMRQLRRQTAMRRKQFLHAEQEEKRRERERRETALRERQEKLRQDLLLTGRRRSAGRGRAGSASHRRHSSSDQPPPQQQPSSQQSRAHTNPEQDTPHTSHNHTQASPDTVPAQRPRLVSVERVGSANVVPPSPSPLPLPAAPARHADPLRRSVDEVQAFIAEVDTDDSLEADSLDGDAVHPHPLPHHLSPPPPPASHESHRSDLHSSLERGLQGGFIDALRRSFQEDEFSALKQAHSNQGSRPTSRRSAAPEHPASVHPSTRKVFSAVDVQTSVDRFYQRHVGELPQRTSQHLERAGTDVHNNLAGIAASVYESAFFENIDDRWFRAANGTRNSDNDNAEEPYQTSQGIPGRSKRAPAEHTLRRHQQQQPQAVLQQRYQPASPQGYAGARHEAHTAAPQHSKDIHRDYVNLHAISEDSGSMSGRSVRPASTVGSHNDGALARPRNHSPQQPDYRPTGARAHTRLLRRASSGAGRRKPIRNAPAPVNAACVMFGCSAAAAARGYCVEHLRQCFPSPLAQVRKPERPGSRHSVRSVQSVPARPSQKRFRFPSHSSQQRPGPSGRAAADDRPFSRAMSVPAPQPSLSPRATLSASHRRSERQHEYFIRQAPGDGYAGIMRARQATGGSRRQRRQTHQTPADKQQLPPVQTPGELSRAVQALTLSVEEEQLRKSLARLNDRLHTLLDRSDSHRPPSHTRDRDRRLPRPNLTLPKLGPEFQTRLRRPGK